MRPDSIEVTVEKNVLSVQAERKWKTEEVETVTCERTVGTFARDLLFGENLDTDRIAASYEGGVLRLTIPDAEELKARRIAVRTPEKPQKKEATATASAG